MLAVQEAAPRKLGSQMQTICASRVNNAPRFDELTKQKQDRLNVSIVCQEATSNEQVANVGAT